MFGVHFNTCSLRAHNQVHHGCPQEFFQKGQNRMDCLKRPILRRVKGANKQKISRIFRRFRIFCASDEGVSNNFRVYCTETAYDVNIFKFQGGNCPMLPPCGRPWSPLTFLGGRIWIDDKTCAKGFTKFDVLSLCSRILLMTSCRCPLSLIIHAFDAFTQLPPFSSV